MSSSIVLSQVVLGRPMGLLQSDGGRRAAELDAFARKVMALPDLGGAASPLDRSPTQQTEDTEMTILS